MTDFGTPTLLDMLGPDDIGVLRAFAKRQRYQDGAIIHDRGDEHTSLSIVVTGKVRFFRLRRGGQLIYESSILPGQNYGDIVALFHTRRSHRAVAVGDTEIDHIDQEGFNHILDGHPAIVRALYRIASFRLMYTTEAIDDLRSLETHVLLAKMLRTMHVSATRPGNRIACVQEELAGLLGVSAVSLAKALRRLEGEGLLRTGYREVILTDPLVLDRWLADRVSI